MYPQLIPEFTVDSLQIIDTNIEYRPPAEVESEILSESFSTDHLQHAAKLGRMLLRGEV